jgi:hypothetical protein
MDCGVFLSSLRFPVLKIRTANRYIRLLPVPRQNARNQTSPTETVPPMRPEEPLQEYRQEELVESQPPSPAPVENFGARTVVGIDTETYAAASAYIQARPMQYLALMERAAAELGPHCSVRRQVVTTGSPVGNRRKSRHEHQGTTCHSTPAASQHHGPLDPVTGAPHRDLLHTLSAAGLTANGAQAHALTGHGMTGVGCWTPSLVLPDLDRAASQHFSIARPAHHVAEQATVLAIRKETTR